MSYNELKQHGTEDFPIELYHIDASDSRYEMSAHWHNELEIIRVLEGALDVRLNNNFYSVKKDEIIFVNPEIIHQASPVECVYECLDFHLDFIPALNNGSIHFIDSLKNNEYIIDEYHKNSPISSAVNVLFDAMKEKSSGYKFKVIGALYNLFGEIIDLHLYHPTDTALLAADKNVPKLKSVLSYIRSNYDSQITLEDMAEAAGMSPKYFCYFFKEMTMKTPVEYLTLYRIERASGRLIKSDLSVTDIAFSCGFNDLSYFIKTFKQIKGITPARFRKESIH